MAMIDVWRTRRGVPSRLTSTTSHLAELARMQRDVKKLVERFFGDLRTEPGTAAFAPPVDIVDRGGEIVVKTDLPGLEQNDIQIELEDGVLTIRGERKEDRRQEADHYRWSERWNGSFLRAITLPTGVDPSKIQAQFKNGVLEVRMQTKQEPVTKKLDVEGEGKIVLGSWPWRSS